MTQAIEKAKHTPGPWEVGPVDDTVVTQLGADGVRYEIAAVDGDYNDPETWPVMEANARLIAAAPDLLNEHHVRVGDLFMLQKAIVAGDPQRELLIRVDDMLRETRAIIAKAEGRS